MTTISRVSAILLALIVTAGPALLAAPLPTHETVLSSPAAPHSTALELVKLLGYGVAAVGAIRIKDTATLAGKYVTRAGAAVGDYKSGVEQAGGDWEANAKAGESNYEAGVQEAISKKRYGRGISSAGAGKYVSNAATLGSQRYQPGVANAKDAWSRGVQPALDKLKSLTLPPKGPRRSPQNQARANMVALELGKLKEAS
jgi:hypothetical protein